MGDVIRCAFSVRELGPGFTELTVNSVNSGPSITNGPMISPSLSSIHYRVGKVPDINIRVY